MTARPWPRAAAAIPIVPLVMAAVRAIQGDWYPIGDNAFFALRARDVLTEHHPLLGTWTSASLTVGRVIHNPGPLLFDVLAIPAKVDPVVGTIVAVVALHAASVVLGVRWAGRVAGPTGAWAISAAFLALEWAMGSEILVEPWQPHSLLLPFLAFLVLVWAVAAGEAGALPWAAGVASLLLQTHLSYAVLVPALAVVGTGALVVADVRAHGASATWARLRRPALLTALVLALAWSQPVIDQVTGEGNLGAVVSTGAGDGEVAGPRFAARVLASVGTVPGGWGPGGYEGLHVDLEEDRPAGAAPTLAGLTDLRTAAPWLTLAGVLGGLAVWCTWRDRSRAWAAALGVATVGLVATFVTVAQLPVNASFGIGAHQIRPVWPVVLFATVVVAAALARQVPRAAAALPVAAGVLLVLALPAHNPRTGPSADAWAIPVTRQLVGQLDEVEAPGLVYVELVGIRFAEPYSTPVLLELQRRGIEFVADAEPAAQLGPSRVWQPDDPVALELRVVEGGAARDPEAGWTRVAFVEGLDADEERELAGLDASGDSLDDGRRARRAELRHQRDVETVAVLVRSVG